MKLSQSFEDYLEAIYILEVEGKPIKASTIATNLEVTKPAVTKAMNDLLTMFLIEKTPYSQIKLTDAGREIAKSVYHRHTVIRDFLTKIGVSKETAEKDCCMIEHVISSETLTAMEKFKK